MPRLRSLVTVVRFGAPQALSPAARVSQLLSQGGADEGLHPYLVPHAKLLEPAGRAERNPSGELRQLLVLMLAGEHLHVAITL